LKKISSAALLLQENQDVYTEGWDHEFQPSLFLSQFSAMQLSGLAISCRVAMRYRRERAQIRRNDFRWAESPSPKLSQDQEARMQLSNISICRGIYFMTFIALIGLAAVAVIALAESGKPQESGCPWSL
jgi:hypothetical protein